MTPVGLDFLGMLISCAWLVYFEWSDIEQAWSVLVHFHYKHTLLLHSWPQWNLGFVFWSCKSWAIFCCWCFQEIKSTMIFRNICLQDLTRTQLTAICSKPFEKTCTTGQCLVSIIIRHYYLIAFCRVSKADTIPLQFWNGQALGKSNSYSSFVHPLLNLCYHVPFCLVFDLISTYCL